MPSDIEARPEIAGVPIGFGSQVGTGGGIAAFVYAYVAYKNGDRSEETIAGLVVGGLLILSVVWGRMLQAIAQVKATQPKVVAVATAPPPTPLTTELKSALATGIVGEDNSFPSDTAMADHDREIEGEGYEPPDGPAHYEANEIEDAEVTR